MEKFDHMSFLICDAEWLLILNLLHKWDSSLLPEISNQVLVHSFPILFIFVKKLIFLQWNSEDMGQQFI